MFRDERPERGPEGVAGPPPAADNRWSRSLWLEGVVGDLTPREALSGEQTCDVAIVGGGFAGLWTAYYLKAADPSLRVSLVEAEIAGFGAAGRNGGFVSAGIAGSGARYARASGWDSVLRAERETQHGVDEIGRVVSSEGIDCGYRKGGAMRVATPLRRWSVCAPWSRRSTGSGSGPRTSGCSPPMSVPTSSAGADGVLAGSFNAHCARVDPARLARGLASACERLGVKIYEQSPAEHLGSKLVQCRDGRSDGRGGGSRHRVLHDPGAGRATQLPAPVLLDDRHRTPPAADLGRARVAGRSRGLRLPAPLLLRPADDGRQDRTRRARGAVPTDQPDLTPERAGPRRLPAAGARPCGKRSRPRRRPGSPTTGAAPWRYRATGA